MPLETATYINQLVATNPDGAVDTKNTLDDHLRLIKSTLRQTLPNYGGQVTVTHTETNFLAGVTSNIQTQLNTLTTADAAKVPLAGGTFTGPPIWATAPSAAGHLTNKAYVDGAYSAASVAQSAANNAQTTANNATTAAAAAQSTANSALNADNLSSGTVPTARLPAGSTSAAGILQVTNSVSSTSTTTAAAPNAVKTAYDLAASKASPSAATLAASGSWTDASTGFTKKWGFGTSTNDGAQGFSFVTPFANACFSVVISVSTANIGRALSMSGAPSTSGFTLNRDTAIDNSVDFYYEASGY